MKPFQINLRNISCYEPRISPFLMLISLGIIAISTLCFAPQRAQVFAEQATPQIRVWEAFKILDAEIQPGTKQRLFSLQRDDLVGMRMAIPVWIVRGQMPGRTLCITAGIHGDELNGVEIARRIFVETNPSDLSGTLFVLPALNTYGLRAGSRYMHDRRDLNRAFPGNPKGSAAGIIASSVFEPIISKAEALVDLHTASDRRINLPQIRTDLSSLKALDLARHFGIGVVLHGKGPKGSLRRTALDSGIPAIIYEAGSVNILQTEEIERGVRGVRNVMRFLGMISQDKNDDSPMATVYQKTRWLRVPMGAAGMFLTPHHPGDEVRHGDVLGKVVDPLSDKEFPIVSSDDGIIVGMVVPSVVLPGDALFHIGLEIAQE